MAALLVAIPARGMNATGHMLPMSTASGWAGYVVRAGGRTFTDASGTWVEPRIVCNRPQSSAAFWVGIGGAERDSRALEQIGTSADCSESASSSYSAWYQLVPAPPVDIPIVIRPGDLVSARVSLRGRTVDLELRNRSTGASFATEVIASSLESGSAEWIAEAPATCFTLDCTPLPLADFAQVVFSNAHASAGLLHGSIAASAWTTQPIGMSPDSRAPLVVPTRLWRRGSSFALRKLAEPARWRIVKR
jgi:Peptidase A4 family